MTLVKTFEKAAFAFAAVATLAAALVTTEANAAGYMVNAKATTAHFPNWDRLNMRSWPASHSQIKFQIKRNRTVNVQRCILKSGTDWCLVSQAGKPWKQGWVNGSFIRAAGQNFATPHSFAYGWH